MATNEVTIVICYQEGTWDVLFRCIGSLYRHTKIPFNIDILTQQTKLDQAVDEIKSVRDELGVDSDNFNIFVFPIGSAGHQGVRAGRAENPSRHNTARGLWSLQRIMVGPTARARTQPTRAS